jgi:vitamin B12 transporter
MLVPTARLYSSLLALGLPLGSASAAEPVAVEPIVVTATRTAQPISALLSDVRIIDAADIAAAGTQTLTELLQAKGGVEISANGGPGQVSGVFIRGTNTNHVVLLVDGVRINSATTGSNAFENIPLDQIDRIEILRGPASSLYGADAIGGVIQIFTKQGGDRTFASAGAGTWRSERYTMGLTRSVGTTRFNLQAGYHETRAFSATNEKVAFGAFNPDDDPYRNKDLGLNVSHLWATDQEIIGRALVSEGTTHFDAGPDSDDVNRQRLSTYALESRNKIFSTWQSTLRFARGTDDSTISGANPGAFRTDQNQATWQNDIAAAGGQIAAGLEYRHEAVTSDTAYEKTSRTIRSAFAGYSTAFDAHLLQASVRHDDNSQFGKRATGNLAYGYRITPDWRLSGGVGNAFKAPSFNDLYFPLMFGFKGNPDLKPERALNREAAIHYDGGAQHAGLTFYHNRIRDLIAANSDFTSVTNINEARIRGATLFYGVDMGGYRAKAEITHENATDTSSDNRPQLIRRAKNFGTLSAGKTLGAWRFGAELVASGPRFDSPVNSAASRMAGYALLHLHGAYSLTPALAISARWNNVLDKHYELAQGYNTPRSNVFVALQYTP